MSIVPPAPPPDSGAAPGTAPGTRRRRRPPASSPSPTRGSPPGATTRQPTVPQRAAAHPWWFTPPWVRYLQDLLWFRSRRRYTLSVSTRHPLGATDPQTRLVAVNPQALAYPHTKRLRAGIRHAPGGRELFEQALTVGLVEHEAGHIRFSGTKPHPTRLGWLWNSLEDERMERLLSAQYPELLPVFEFVGDVVWRLTSRPTGDLLAGCLLWRWEHDHVAVDRRFHPASQADQIRWSTQIQPLVEQAWMARDSDQVTVFARTILQVLGLDEEGEPPPDSPADLCGCGGGDTHRPADAHAPDAAPPAPTGSALPGHTGRPPHGSRDNSSGAGAGLGQGHRRDNPTQADPDALLAAVEGPARDLARWLRPPVAHGMRRPHPNRGEFNLDHLLAGHDERPFDAPIIPATETTRAWMLVVDMSGSTGDRVDPHSIIAGCARIAMWLDRVAELAHLTFGVAGFDGDVTPIVLRPLTAAPAPETARLARRRIAGMDGDGGTQLAPTLRWAGEALQATTASRRALLVTLDGALDAHDARAARAVVADLAQRHRVLTLALYLGADPQIRTRIAQVFDAVVACPALEDLSALVVAWLRASGA